jgi:hypothetical protein
MLMLSVACVTVPTFAGPGTHPKRGFSGTGDPEAIIWPTRAPLRPERREHRRSRFINHRQLPPELSTHASGSPRLPALSITDEHDKSSLHELQDDGVDFRAFGHPASLAETGHYARPQPAPAGAKTTTYLGYGKD